MAVPRAVVHRWAVQSIDGWSAAIDRPGASTDAAFEGLPKGIGSKRAQKAPPHMESSLYLWKIDK